MVSDFLIFKNQGRIMPMHQIRIYFSFFGVIIALSSSGNAEAVGKKIKKTIGLKSHSAMLKEMNYGIGFGEQSTKAGEVFKFKDFSLKFQGYRLISEEEKKLKQKSIAANIDGGSSMLSHSNKFLIFEKSDNEWKIELSILPYAKYLFEANRQKFELRNSPTKGARWIIYALE